MKVILKGHNKVPNLYLGLGIDDGKSLFWNIDEKLLFEVDVIERVKSLQQWRGGHFIN